MTTFILVYQGRELPVSGEITLGRSTSCGLAVSDKIASRQHAKVGLEADGRPWVEDLGSANGTRVNGRKIQGRRHLVHGDRITIGASHVVVQAPETVAANPAPSAVETDTDPVMPAPAAPAVSPAATPGSEGSTVPAPPSVAPSPRPATDGRRAPARPEALVGQILGGCRLQAILGQGAMGTVYKAKQLSLDREVALKVFRHDVVMADESFAERLIQEARLAGKVNHEGIAQVHECGRDGELLWYSMELVSGETLDQLIRRDRRVDPDLALIVTEKVARALQAVHVQGIIHRDIKPGNIMISNAGQVKLLDLGLAQVLQEGRQSAERSAVVGTPAYMSPEQAQDAGCDQRSDIYSLGCTLVHLLLGRPPYTGRNALEVISGHLNSPLPDLKKERPELPSVFGELVQGMLAKNPDWRFQTVGECLDVIARARSAAPEAPASAPAARPARASAASPPAARTSESRRPRRPGNSPAFIGLAVVGLLVLITVVVASRRDDHPPAKPGTEPEPTGPRTGEIASVAASSSGTAVRPPVNPSSSGATAADPLAQRWTAVQAEVAALRGKDDWSRAEYTLRRFAGEVPADHVLAATVANRLSELRLDAGRWYANAVDLLPPASEQHAAARLARLATLRNAVLSVNRSDAEALYRGALALLTRRVATARRQAVLLLERGETAGVAALAAPVLAALAGSPVESLGREFASQAGEASRIVWKDSWPTTRLGFASARGEAALAAGACLLLLGERRQAVELLLADPALAREPLASRRRILLSSQAVFLDFENPSDLQYLDAQAGELAIAGGALAAKGGGAVGTRCTVPIEGRRWEIACDLALGAPASGGQVVLSLVGADGPPALALNIDDEAVRLTAATAGGRIEQKTALPDGRRLLLRLRADEGAVQVLLGGEIICDGQKVVLPATCRLGLDAAGLEWSLNELSIIGGG